MAKYIIVVLGGIAAGLVIALHGIPGSAPRPLPVDAPARTQSGPRETIDALIAGLGVDDPKARAIFHSHLVEETGMFFGFKPAALPEERGAAIRRWRGWWQANRRKTREQWLVDSLAMETYGAKAFSLKKLAEMSSQTCIPVVTALLDSEEPELRMQAATALGQLKAVSATDRLSRLLAADTNPSVRRAAVRALGRIASKEALDTLAGTAQEKDVLTKIEAASALVLHSPPQALPVLYSLLSENEEQAVRFAVVRLRELRRPESVPHLAKLLTGEEPYPEMARRALEAIVGQDLGAQQAPWLEWYENLSNEANRNPM